MKKNKLIAFALSLCLIVGLVPSIAANAAVKDTRTPIESSQEIKDSEKSTTIETEGTIVAIPTKPNSEIKTSGVKSKAVLKVAKMLATNSKKAVNALEWAGLLDTESAAVLRANCGDIAEYLESIANYGASAAAFVRSNLPSVLRGWGIDSGISENIAYALSYAIKAADWIFL